MQASIKEAEETTIHGISPQVWSSAIGVQGLSLSDLEYNGILHNKNLIKQSKISGVAYIGQYCRNLEFD